jgi:hypothetical protein
MTIKHTGTQAYGADGAGFTVMSYEAILGGDAHPFHVISDSRLAHIYSPDVSGKLESREFDAPIRDTHMSEEGWDEEWDKEVERVHHALIHGAMAFMVGEGMI